MGKDFSKVVNPFDVQKEAAKDIIKKPKLEEPKKRGRKPDNPDVELKHLHLIVPEEQIEAIKQLAKINNVSVNQFMKGLIDSHMESWKPILQQFELMSKKMFGQ